MRPPNGWLRLRGTVEQLRRMEWAQIHGLLLERRRGCAPRTNRPRGRMETDMAPVERLAHLFPGLRVADATGSDDWVGHDALCAECEGLLRGRLMAAGEQTTFVEVAEGGNRPIETRHSYERFYFIGKLGAAAVITGREDFVRFGADRIDRWLDGAPGDVSWAPMNVSERVMQWTVFAACALGRVEPHRLARWLSSIHQQVGFLAGHLERRAGNNHLLFNARSLLLGATLFEPTLERGLGALGRDLLLSQMDRQFGSDGAHLESCPGYHLWVTQCLAECRVLCRRLPGATDLTDPLVSSLARARQALSVMTTPRGTVAAFGDSKDSDATASPADLGICGTDSRRTWWSIIWGAEPGSSTAVDTPSTAVQCLPSTGFCAARWRDRTHLAFRAGPLSAYSPNPGHAHADVLSVVLEVAGRPLLTDTGTETYEAGPRRDYERSAAAHNTVHWGVSDQALFWRAFRVAFLPDTDDAFCAEEAGGGFRCGGRYSLTAPGPLRYSQHGRTVSSPDGRLFVIADRLRATAACEPCWRFVLDPQWQAEPHSGQQTLYPVGAPESSVQIAAWERTARGWVQLELRTEEVAVSPAYGRSRSTSALCFERSLVGERVYDTLTLIAPGVGELTVASVGGGLGVRLGNREWSVGSGSLHGCDDA